MSETPDSHGDIEDDVMDMMMGLKEHLAADHVVRVLDQEEMTKLLASTFGVLTSVSVALSGHAMVLQRIPDSREHIAEHLEQLAYTLRTLVPVDYEVGDE